MLCSFPFTFLLYNMVTYFQSRISCVNVQMYLVSIYSVLKSINTCLSVIRVIIYRRPINWSRNWFILCYTHSCSAKPPSSKFTKVIISPVCSWNDVLYGLHNAYGRVASASKYGHGWYANALEKDFQIQLHVKRIFLVN